MSAKCSLCPCHSLDRQLSLTVSEIRRSHTLMLTFSLWLFFASASEIFGRGNTFNIHRWRPRLRSCRPVTDAGSRASCQRIQTIICTHIPRAGKHILCAVFVSTKLLIFVAANKLRFFPCADATYTTLQCLVALSTVKPYRTVFYNICTI